LDPVSIIIALFYPNPPVPPIFPYYNLCNALYSLGWLLDFLTPTLADIGLINLLEGATDLESCWVEISALESFRSVVYSNEF